MLRLNKRNTIYNRKTMMRHKRKNMKRELNKKEKLQSKKTKASLIFI